MIKRHKSLAAVAIIVIVALFSFGLTAYFRSASRRSEAPKFDPVEREHLQNLITGVLGEAGFNQVPALPAKKTPPQYAENMSFTANSVTIGAQRMDGFTLNFSWQGLALRIGWTIQPNTVREIDNYIRANPALPDAGKLMIAAQVCGARLPGLGRIVCEAIFTAFGTYTFGVFHNANLNHVCVTLKTYLPVLGVFDPYHPKWDAFPYVDGGSWCHKEIYTTPPPAPNPQGPRTPGDCSADPTRRGCNV